MLVKYFDATYLVNELNYTITATVTFPLNCVILCMAHFCMVSLTKSGFLWILVKQLIHPFSLCLDFILIKAITREPPYIVRFCLLQDW